MMQFPVDAKDIIPHRESMLLLDKLCASSSDFMEGKTVIKPGNIFISSRGLDAACFVELLAQLAAAGDGYESTKAGKPVRSGFLAGVNDFMVMGKAVAGDELDLKLRKGMQLNNFTIVEGDVYRGKDLLAKGNLKLFVFDNPSPLKKAYDPATAGCSAENELPGETLVHNYFRSKISGMESTQDGLVRGKISFDHDFPGFRGHFPGYPIVPGVALLHLTLVLAEQASSCPMVLSAVDRAKFSRQVLPGDQVAAEVKVVRDDDSFTIKAGLTIEGKSAGSFIMKTRKVLKT